MKITADNLKTVLLSGCMALTMVAVPVGVSQKTFTAGSIISKAQAAEDSEGGKGKMKMGQDAGASKGKGAGAIGGSGKGQGGPSADSEGKGPRASMPDGGTRGGKPAWAQEGLPDVELGRLNVARAPGHVLDRALEEVLLNWTDEKTALYGMSLADFIAALATMDEGTRVDSPLENLSLYKDLMIDGESSTPVQPVGTSAILTLAAIYFGSASDKTVPITTDTVKAINIILGLDVNDAAVDKIATDAEAVRQAILDAHG